MLGYIRTLCLPSSQAVVEDLLFNLVTPFLHWYHLVAITSLLVKDQRTRKLNLPMSLKHWVGLFKFCVDAQHEENIMPFSLCPKSVRQKAFYFSNLTLIKIYTSHHHQLLTSFFKLVYNTGFVIIVDAHCFHKWISTPWALGRERKTTRVERHMTWQKFSQSKSKAES